MLCAGGIDDQPAGRWIARNVAGSILQLLEKTSAPGFDFGTIGALTADELQMWNEIQKVKYDATARIDRTLPKNKR